MGRLKQHRQYIMLLLTGWLCGLLCGAIAVMIYSGYQLDLMHQQLNRLQISVQEKTEQLEKLSEHSRNTKQLVKTIEIELTLDSDEAEHELLLTALKQHYYNVLGKEVTSLDPDLLLAMIDNRLLRLNDHTYQVTVTKVVVASRLKIWATASLKKF